MSIHSADGCEGRDGQSITDRVVVLAGVCNDTTAEDPRSLGLYAYGVGNSGQAAEIYIPFLLGALSGTGWGMKFGYYHTVHNVGHRVGAGIGSTEILTVSTTAAGLWTLAIVGTVVDTSTTAAQLTTWETVSIKVDHQTGGTVSVKIDGTEVISYTLTAGNITAMTGTPTSTYMIKATSGITRLDDIVVVDESADADDIDDYTTAVVKSSPRTSNGDFTDGTGDYTDIDELPFSATDKLTFTAAAEKADFGSADDVPTGYLLKAVVVTARVQRVGTGAGSQIRAYLRESSLSLNGTTVAAPLDAVVGWVFSTQRDLSAWTKSDYALHKIGLEAIT